MTSRKTVDSLPSDAIPCNGPLMYDLNRYIAPNGILYKPMVSGRYQVITITTHKDHLAWDNAKMLINGEIKPMDDIHGFYTMNKSKGQVVARALVAYYFVEKIENPVNMRAVLKNEDAPLSAENVEWVSAQEQTNRRMTANRSKSRCDNEYKQIDPSQIDLNEFKEWNGYWIKKDGNQIITTKKGKYRNIRIAESGGYKNVTLYIDKKPCSFKMNRLIVQVFGGASIPSDKKVDHIGGDTLNDAFENLEIVDHKENVRRGKVSAAFSKVDPNSFKVLERYRCITEFCEQQGEGFDARELSMRLSNGMLYQNFLWVAEADKNIRYSERVVGEDTFVDLVNINDVIVMIRKRIDNMLLTRQITEDMIPIIDNKPKPTESMRKILSELDSRGIGNRAMMEETNLDIVNTISCCRLISYFGKGDEAQVVICLKTLLVFTRSRENLRNKTRQYCMVCSKKKVSDSKTHPVTTIPVYEYSNSGQHQFIRKHDSMREVLDHHGGVETTASVSYTMDTIAASMFNIMTNDTSSKHVSRVSWRNFIYSFHPPIHGKLNETSPNWILQRRLNAEMFIAMRERGIKRKN